MKIGDIEITPLVDGELSVPATAAYPSTTEADWEPHKRWLTHDGRIELTIGCFLIRTAGRAILVDAGLGRNIEGDGWRFAGGRLIDDLAAHGLSPVDITDVVFTHLHFDHVGWAAQQGQVVFTNATFRCDSKDWAHFVGPKGDGEASGKLNPVADRLEAFDGQTTLAPGVDTMPTPGHTPGHTALVVSSGTARAILLGDAVHCPVELEELEWDGLGDVDAALAKRTREAMLDELERPGTIASAAHFPGLIFGRVLRGEGKPSWTTSGPAGT
jgi:glyoxylase-like metal-dependent hydrolase (beta-lactamase superfamily II)